MQAGGGPLLSVARHRPGNRGGPMGGRQRVPAASDARRGVLCQGLLYRLKCRAVGL